MKSLSITWSDEDASSNSDSDGKHLSNYMAFTTKVSTHVSVAFDVDDGLEDKLVLSFCKPTILCWKKGSMRSECKADKLELQTP